MTQDQIRFDVLVQEALRGVVKKVLGEVVKTGLPGDHHFYISFDTRFPGARISSRLRQRYPEEITIVLQHQFWDLTVSDHAFEVGLSFNGIPEKLFVPFAAVKGFFDPSVQFGLQFEVVREGAEGTTDAPKPHAEGKAGRPAKAGPTLAPLPAPKSVPAAAKRAPTEAPVEPPAVTPPAVADKPAVAETPKATVVSLDQFRKKP